MGNMNKDSVSKFKITSKIKATQVQDQKIVSLTQTQLFHQNGSAKQSKFDELSNSLISASQKSSVDDGARKSFRQQYGKIFQKPAQIAKSIHQNQPSSTFLQELQKRRQELDMLIAIEEKNPETLDNLMRSRMSPQNIHPEQLPRSSLVSQNSRKLSCVKTQKLQSRALNLKRSNLPYTTEPQTNNFRINNIKSRSSSRSVSRKNDIELESFSSQMGSSFLKQPSGDYRLMQPHRRSQFNQQAQGLSQSNKNS